jgi:hypothetical protein
MHDADHSLSIATFRKLTLPIYKDNVLYNHGMVATCHFGVYVNRSLMRMTGTHFAFAEDASSLVTAPQPDGSYFQCHVQTR